MNLEKFRNYCLHKNEVTESTPFGEDHLVYKVCGKMFALTGINDIPFSANLKCNPEYSIELREQWEEIEPGYHMNKKHWITITLSNNFPDSLFLELVDHSYNEVIKGLAKKDRERLLAQ